MKNKSIITNEKSCFDQIFVKAVWVLPSITKYLLVWVLLYEAIFHL